MHHYRTLDADSPQTVWDYTRWALDHEASIAWPGATFVAERIEDTNHGRVRIVREYRAEDNTNGQSEGQNRGSLSHPAALPPR